jgi:DNA-binding NtrC family response regulator
VASATNRPREKLVEAERFRSDLLARLGHQVVLPPLRERPEDIPLLVEHFLKLYDRGAPRKRFADETMERLQRYPWELNVRQLQQVVEAVALLVDEEVIRPDHLPASMRGGAASAAAATPELSASSPPRPLRDVVEDVERAHILRTLEFTHGNRRKAIELLQMSSETFYKRLEDWGIHKKGH